MTPQNFAQLLQRQGLKADLSIADGRIAQIIGGGDEIEYTLTFLPRAESGSSVYEFGAFTFLFRVRFEVGDPLEFANIQNSRGRFARCWADGDLLTVEMDVAISDDELTEEIASRQTNIWIITLSRIMQAFQSRENHA